MNELAGFGEDLSPGLFTSTHWSVVLRAQDKSEAALETLCQSYRKPLLVWLQSRGKSLHDAEDVVQGFLASLIRRDFLKNVAREKGRFRTFLLTSLKNHLHDVHDKSTAIKRGSGRTVESLDEANESGAPVHEPASGGDGPDREFDRAWAQTILANSLRQLEVECARTGHAALCAALQPVMFADETAASYREIGEKLGMSEGSVKVAAHRIRSRLKGLIREEVLQTITSADQFEEEIRYLISLFGR